MSGQFRWSAYSVDVVDAAEESTLYLFRAKNQDHAARVARDLFKAANPHADISRILVRWHQGKRAMMFTGRARRVRQEEKHYG